MPKNSINLTEEQIREIKNYNKSIKTLKTFTEMVREAKGMYIGYTGNRGFERMFREVFQNSVDELMRANSPCNMVKVTYDERTLTAIVEDNGRGIPFGNIERIFTKQHTSSNYEKVGTNGSFTSGVNGVGAKVTNALSHKFIVESYILGDARRVEFNEGYIWDKGEQKIPNKDNRQGTIILFDPSEVMGRITTNCDDILKIIKSISPLTHIGDKIYYKAIFADGKEEDVVVTNEDGIMGIIIDICKKPLIKPITFSGIGENMNFEVYMTYDISEGADIEII